MPSRNAFASTIPPRPAVLVALCAGLSAGLALGVLPGRAEARCTDAACVVQGPGAIVPGVGVRLVGPRAVLAGMPLQYTATVTRTPGGARGTRGIGFRIVESPPAAAPGMGSRPAGRPAGRARP